MLSIIFFYNIFAKIIKSPINIENNAIISSIQNGYRKNIETIQKDSRNSIIKSATKTPKHYE